MKIPNFWDISSGKRLDEDSIESGHYVFAMAFELSWL